jgi:hypothetical protein
MRVAVGPSAAGAPPRDAASSAASCRARCAAAIFRGLGYSKSDALAFDVLASPDALLVRFAFLDFSGVWAGRRCTISTSGNTAPALSTASPPDSWRFSTCLNRHRPRATRKIGGPLCQTFVRENATILGHVSYEQSTKRSSAWQSYGMLSWWTFIIHTQASCLSTKLAMDPERKRVPAALERLYMQGACIAWPSSNTENVSTRTRGNRHRHGL